MRWYVYALPGNSEPAVVADTDLETICRCHRISRKNKENPGFIVALHDNGKASHVICDTPREQETP